MKSLELLPWVRIPHRRDVPDTMLCDKVCEWLAASRWFSPVTPVSSTNKTDRHDIAEILLKVALNIITLTPSSDLYLIVCCLLYILYIHENKYTTNNKSCFSKKWHWDGSMDGLHTIGLATGLHWPHLTLRCSLEAI